MCAAKRRFQARRSSKTLAPSGPVMELSASTPLSASRPCTSGRRPRRTLAPPPSGCARISRRMGGDRNRIVLMGHSSGASHVAIYIFHEELQPAGGDDGVVGAILLSGGYDPTTS